MLLGNAAQMIFMQLRGPEGIVPIDVKISARVGEEKDDRVSRENTRNVAIVKQNLQGNQTDTLEMCRYTLYPIGLNQSLQLKTAQGVLSTKSAHMCVMHAYD